MSPGPGQSRLAPQPRKGGAPGPSPLPKACLVPAPQPPSLPFWSPLWFSLARALPQGGDCSLTPRWAPSPHVTRTVSWGCLGFLAQIPGALQGTPAPHSPIQKFLVSKSLSVTSLVVSKRPR